MRANNTPRLTSSDGSIIDISQRRWKSSRDVFLWFDKKVVRRQLPRLAGGQGEGGVRSATVIPRITRHGLPAATTPAGMSFVTTLPAPMTVPSPIVTPGQMIAPPPIQTSGPIVTG